MADQSAESETVGSGRGVVDFVSGRRRRASKETNMKTTLLIALSAISALGFSQTQSRFGGPMYDAGPALNVTASLVKAGGGPEHFSITTALTNMVGEDTFKGEVASLTKRYGEKRVMRFVKIFNFAVNDALG